MDTDRFAELLEEQRGRARADAKKVPIGLDAGAAPPTEFVGYERLEADGTIVSLLDAEFRELDEAEEGQEVRLFLDRTPFYAEGGGQVGDRGLIRTPSGVIRVTDTVPAGDRSIVHSGVVESGEVRPARRRTPRSTPTARGDGPRPHVHPHRPRDAPRAARRPRPAGGVARGARPAALRLPASVGGLGRPARGGRAASRTAASPPTTPRGVFETSMDEAKRLGAVMLFGEKYGDTVRVVEIGDYSRELCGGTHVERTGHVGVIRLLHEGSIGAGMRRVEALVGPDALREINAERALLHDLVEALGSTGSARGDRPRAP